MRRRHLTATALLGALTVLSTACGITVDSLPLPAPGAGGKSYEIKAVFANALNLPTKAKVKLDGADIGEVETMKAQNYTAIVTMHIEDSVRLPVGTTAELRSATPIGDVFVGLTPPDNAATGTEMITDGYIIPLKTTAAASTIEDLLTRAALIVNGGSIRNITTLVNGLGQRLGGKGGRVGELIDHTRQLVSNLSARTESIRTALADTNALSITLQRQEDDINNAIAAASPALSVIGDNTGQIVELVNQLNRTTTQLEKFPVVKGTNGRSLSADVNLLAMDLNRASNNQSADLTFLLDSMPRVAKLTNGQAAHIYGDINKIVLGAAADPNNPKLDGSKVPDLTDIANIVGSLTYSLNRLKDKVIGPGR